MEVEAEGWLEDMLGSLSEGVITPVKTPKTFNGKLRFQTFFVKESLSGKQHRRDFNPLAD